jgi:hypothetical protein
MSVHCMHSHDRPSGLIKFCSGKADYPTTVNSGWANSLYSVGLSLFMGFSGAKLKPRFIVISM